MKNFQYSTRAALTTFLILGCALWSGAACEMMQTISAALRDDDAMAVQKAAHTLKNALKFFRATKAADLALGLESLGREGDLSNAGPVFDSLRQEVDRLIPVLVAFCED